MFLEINIDLQPVQVLYYYFESLYFYTLFSFKLLGFCKFVVFLHYFLVSESLMFSI